MKESDFPPLYASADAASLASQRQFLWALGGNFVLLAVAATMSVVNYPHANFAIAQAIALASSLSLTVFLAFKQPQRIWYGTRALAESIKTISWRYAMRAEPFNTPDHEADVSFTASVRKIFDSNKEVSSHAVDFNPGSLITSAMRQLRSQPLMERKESYREHRIDDQLGWYTRKAKWNKRRSQKWFVGLIAVNVVAFGCALFRIEFPTIEHWPTDIFVATAASMMGWLQTKRFQELAGSYTLTAHEIVLLAATMPVGKSEDEFSSFVGDAENAFSREHTQWQARRDIK